jgi:hypothetical protein
VAPHLRRHETVVDDETVRAVRGWVRLADEVAGGVKARNLACASCGSSDDVLEREERPLCARCYLEKGDPETENASASAAMSASPASASPK